MGRRNGARREVADRDDECVTGETPYGPHHDPQGNIFVDFVASAALSNKPAQSRHHMCYVRGE